jgi:hypothetical protein
MWNFKYFNQETHITVQCTLDQGLTGPQTYEESPRRSLPPVTNFYMEIFWICCILGE